MRRTICVRRFPEERVQNKKTMQEASSSCASATTDGALDIAIRLREVLKRLRPPDPLTEIELVIQGLDAERSRKRLRVEAPVPAHDEVPDDVWLRHEAASQLRERLARLGAVVQTYEPLLRLWPESSLLPAGCLPPWLVKQLTADQPPLLLLHTKTVTHCYEGFQVPGSEHKWFSDGRSVRCWDYDGQGKFGGVDPSFRASDYVHVWSLIQEFFQPFGTAQMLLGQIFLPAVVAVIEQYAWDWKPLKASSSEWRGRRDYHGN